MLEVAGGTGYWTQFLAPVAASILAIDAAAETPAIARPRVAEVDCRTVEVGTIAGSDADAMGTAVLEIRVQTRAVPENTSR